MLPFFLEEKKVDICNVSFLHSWLRRRNSTERAPLLPSPPLPPAKKASLLLTHSLSLPRSTCLEEEDRCITSFTSWSQQRPSLSLPNSPRFLSFSLSPYYCWKAAALSSKNLLSFIEEGRDRTAVAAAHASRLQSSLSYCCST